MATDSTVGPLPQKAFVTGAAGFIGSHLTDQLLERGISVVGWDNFSTGQRAFIVNALKNKRFQLIEGDMLDLPSLKNAMKDCDYVFHLAANADIRFGFKNPRIDLEQNSLATFNVLEAMRSNSIRQVIFTSSSAVYGDAQIHPIPESGFFPIQTSLYGAAKLAGEALVQAYCEGYQFRGIIFRFASVLGERYTHGHVFDFYKQLKKDPTHLTVLGDGTQRKTYVYVQDCVDAILRAMMKQLSDPSHKIEIYNLGTEEFCEVRQSAAWISEIMELSPKISYGTEKRGWIGDNPFVFLDIKRILGIGWKPKLNIFQSVERTVHWLENNEWILSER